MVVHHAIDVKAAPDACWQRLSDLSVWPEWFPMCKGARWLDGGSWKVGSRLEMTFHAGPLGVPVVVQVKELEPGKIVRWVGGRLGLSGNHSYTFSVNSPGLTRVTSHEEFSGMTARWLPRKVIERIDGEVHLS